MSGVGLTRLLGLQPEQFSRAIPFFLIYFLLFTALTLADAVAVSLFASRIGADRLPTWYSATAILSLVMIGIYLWGVTRNDSVVIFGWILATISAMFAAAWWLQGYSVGVVSLGMLFVTREIALTMILMHFGTFLQDFFLRDDLNRILPVIYAGGRVGGIFAGGTVGFLARQLGTVNLIPVVVLLIGIAWAAILHVRRTIEPCEERSEQPQTSVDSQSSTDGDIDRSPVSVPHSIRRFLKQVVTIPLLGWLTMTTLVFVGCRWFLAFHYTSFFEHHFDDDVALAGFLGRYTQIALTVSLLLQLFVVVRLVERIGVPAAQILYSVLVMVGLVANAVASGLPIAIASRFLETELRFGLRNPVNQMIVNRFSKKMRIVVRGWSLGWLIPIGTLIASGLIASLLRLGDRALVSFAGGLLGLAFVISSIHLRRAYLEFRSVG